jgi:toxin HigB-1
LTSRVYTEIDVILSYRNRETERFARGERVRRDSFLQQAERRLRVLDAATELNDLIAMNSNRIEALRGDRTGQFSIRINAQWRVCFEWPPAAAGPSNVEIVDYH